MKNTEENQLPVEPSDESRLQKERYLAGMKRYKEQGILIKIDGKEKEEQDWGQIMEVREDHSFYMADFVTDEDTGVLKEIHFDRVYHG